MAVAPNASSRQGQMRRLAAAALPSKWDAAQRASQHDVLFYAGGGTLAARSDEARNWLVQDFAEATDDALVIQRKPLPSPLGAPSFQPTLSTEGIATRARLRARVSGVSGANVAAIDRLLSFFGDQLGVPLPKRLALRNRAIRVEAYRPHELAALRRVTRRVRPRLVIMDTASYTYNGETVGMFKDEGAYVAEPQHGWIGPSHAAYNYGRAFQNPSLARALPNELLTFGPFWSENIRLPVLKTVIGKPHLDAAVRSATTVVPNRILVVSSRANPDETDRFVEELRSVVDLTWRVVFRPHPAERESVAERYPRLAANADIEVDQNPDVYDSLSCARFVTGVASTVLFEAAAFGCTVIPRDSDFAASVIGDIYGPRVSTAVQVNDRIRELEDERTAREIDTQLWASQSVERYRQWLSVRLSGHMSNRG